MEDTVNIDCKEAKEVINKPVPEILLPAESEVEEGEGEEEEEEWEGEVGGRKVKLVRSHAIRDSTSPPPPRQPTPQSPGRNNHCAEANSNDQRSVVSGSECCEGGLSELVDSPSVSDSGRGDTDTPEESQYTDSTGIDLTQFIISTLNKNTKDRMLMLKLETEMTSLVKDPKKSHHKFPQMSSYHRMLVHRVAAYFGLDHNVDQTGNCVIVNKTKTTRLPDMKFRDHVPEELVLSTTEPKRLILKRESCESCADRFSSDNSSRRSKSIEEREEEYERVKRRIFNDAGRDHQIYTYKYPINLGSTKGANQARSFDIRDSARDSLDRPQVSKSFSFGGYPAAQPLEPHKPGQKSNPPKLSRGQVVWAVSDIASVPKGSILINPDTGTPYLNSDGSVYVFDPSNPPRFAGEEHLSPSPLHSSPSPLVVQQEMAKLSLEGEKQQQQQHMVYSGGWMVSHPPRPTPYILVNPVTPLPQYLPYIYPSYQEGGGQDLNVAQPQNLQGLQQQQPPQQQHTQQPVSQQVMGASQGTPGTPQPGMNPVPSLPVLAAATGPQPPPPPAPLPLVSTINHIPQNGLAEPMNQGQMQLAGRPLLGAPIQKPFLFSIHRSPSHSVVIFLQHCPAILSRSQLVSMLDPFLGGRGHIQFLDPANQWTDVHSLPPDTPTTNRYQIQIVFDAEDQATQTIAALKNAGFLMEPQDL